MHWKTVVAVEADARFEGTYRAAAVALLLKSHSQSFERAAQRCEMYTGRNGNEQRCCDDDAEKNRSSANATVQVREDRVRSIY